MSKTGFSVRTLTSGRHTKLARNTDVVITVVPSPGDGESVMSSGFIPIPWKILNFHANSNTYRSVTIHSEIAVCTVSEKENGVLTPKLSQTLTKGSEIVLKSTEEEGEEEAGGLQWISNTGVTSEQQTQTTPASAYDNFIIKNEFADIRLALCLTDEDGARLPIVDLGELPKDQIFTISGQLCVQAYIIGGQTVGKPLKSMTYVPSLGPMAVGDISQKAFKLYTKQNGSTILE